MTHEPAADHPVRVALVIHRPAQHFTRALQLLCRDPGLAVEVCYWVTPRRSYDGEFDRDVSWDVDLLGGYPWASPPAGGAVRPLRWVLRRLRVFRPDVIVCYGWASPIARASILYCLLSRTRLLLYGDTTWQHASGGRLVFARTALLRILMRLATGAISTGTFNREFYIRHGMNPRRIRPGVCPADTEAFAHARVVGQGPAGNAVGALRIGFAGKLTSRKGPDELLRAAALLPSSAAWSVTIIGVGPLMPQLRTLTVELGLEDRVSFHGFANTSEMPKLLASLDVVVVPSRLDMRALITIEAMAAGAAVVVSNATAVWGSGDLVQHRETGLVYPSGDPVALAREIRILMDDRPLLAMLRSRGAQRAMRYGPQEFARTVAAAVRDYVA